MKIFLFFLRKKWSIFYVSSKKFVFPPRHNFLLLRGAGKIKFDSCFLDKRFSLLSNFVFLLNFKFSKHLKTLEQFYPSSFIKFSSFFFVQTLSSQIRFHHQTSLLTVFPSQTAKLISHCLLIMSVVEWLPWVEVVTKKKEDFVYKILL